MKRTICITLIFIMFLSLTACGDDNKMHLNESGESAFYGCLLEDVALPKSLERLGSTAAKYAAENGIEFKVIK